MIRTATPGEIPVIHAMVRELAEYEKVPDEAKASRQHLHEALFGEQPAAFAHIAEAAGGTRRLCAVVRQLPVAKATGLHNGHHWR
jgi:hypothetical protein